MNLTRYIFLFLIILIFIGLIKCPPGDKRKGKKKTRQEGQPSNLNVSNPSKVYVDPSGLQYIYTPPDQVPYHPIQDYEILSSEELEQINDPYVEQDYGTHSYEQQQVKKKKVGRPLSFVWTYWTIEKRLFEDGELHDAAVCKFCKDYYILGENFTSTLKYHLNNAHKDHPEINFDKLNKAQINKPAILQIDQQRETKDKRVKKEKTEEEREYDRSRNLTSLIYEYFTIGEKKAYCRCYKNDGEICNREMSFPRVTGYQGNLKNHLRSHTDAYNEFLKQNQIEKDQAIQLIIEEQTNEQ